MISKTDLDKFVSLKTLFAGRDCPSCKTKNSINYLWEVLKENLTHIDRVNCQKYRFTAKV